MNAMVNKYIISAKGVDAAFEKFDSDKSGWLDATEFGHSVLVWASMIRHSLIRGRRPRPLRPRDKRRASSRARVEVRRLPIPAGDTTGWFVEGKDANGNCSATVLREQIRTLLQSACTQQGVHIADVVKIFDKDAGSELRIDDVEFHNGLTKVFGFKGPKTILDEVFKSMDTDGEGTIGFDELFEFVRGSRHALDKRAKQLTRLNMRIEPPHNAPWNLDDIQWDCEALRLLLEAALTRCRAGATDLIKAWDRSGDKSLDREVYHTIARALFP